MAGTVVVTEERLGSIHKIKFAWVSSAGGAADGVTTNTYNGEIVRVAQIPDSGGTQPSAGWDCVVNDSDGADVLQGGGANLSEAVVTQSWWETAVANTKLTLAITNAGAAKGGSTIVYIKVR